MRKKSFILITAVFIFGNVGVLYSEEIPDKEIVRILETKIRNLKLIDRRKDMRVHNLHGEKEYLQRELEQYKRRSPGNKSAQTLKVVKSKKDEPYDQLIEAKDLEIRNLRRQQFDIEENLVELEKQNHLLYREVMRFKGRLGEKEDVITQPLQAQAKLLENELTTTEKELSKVLAELNNKIKRLESLIEKNESLNIQLLEVQQERDDLSSRLRQATMELEKKERAYQDSSEEIKHSLKREIKSLNERLVSLESSTQRKILQKEELLEEKENMHKAKLYDYESELKEKRKKANKLSKENRSLKGKLAKVEEKNINLKNKLETIENKYKSLEKSIPQKISSAQQPFEDKIRALESKFKKADQSGRDKVRTAQEPLIKQIAGLEDQVRQKDQQIESFNKKIVESKEQNNILKRLAETLDEDNAELKEELDKAKVNSSDRVAHIKQPLEEEIVRLVEQLDELEETREQYLKEAEDSYKGKIGSQGEKIRILEIALTQKQSDISGLERENSNLLNQISDQDDEIVKLQESNQFRNKQDRELAGENEMLRKDLREVKVENESLRKNLGSKVNLIDEKEAIIDDFLKNQIDLGEEIKVLRVQVEGQETFSIEDAKITERSLINERELLRSELKETQRALSNEKRVSKELKEIITMKSLEYDNLKDSVLDESAVAEQPLFDEIQALKYKISSLEEQLRFVWGSTERILNDFQKYQTSNGRENKITAVENSKNVSTDLSEIGF